MRKFYLAISFHVLATENLAIQFFVVVWCFWKCWDCFLEIWNPSQTVAWKISLVFRWDEWGCRPAAENISMVYLPLYVSNCWSLRVWVIYSTPIIDHFTNFSWHPFLVNELILRSIITWNVTCDTCSLSCVSLAYRCEVDKWKFGKQMWKQENVLALRHDGISPGSKVLFEDEVWTWGQATGNGCVCVQFLTAKGKNKMVSRHLEFSRFYIVNWHQELFNFASWFIYWEDDAFCAFQSLIELLCCFRLWIVGIDKSWMVWLWRSFHVEFPPY